MLPVRREYTSDLCQLAKMRGLVRQECERAWGTGADETISLLELAVGEAATNVILHAYERQPGQPIELVVEADGEGVCIWLYHCGRDFDPCLVPPPEFDGSRESGFGVYLIQRAVDEVQYFQDERGRCGVRLYKKREPQPTRG